MTDAKVLLVEDNPDDEQLILRAFKGVGLEGRIDVAHDGRQALDYLMNSAIPPRLILLDLKLPRLGGLEVLQALRLDNRTRLVPVVVFTSSIEPSDVLTSYDLGANSYIRKPVDYRELTNVIKSVANYWVGLNESLPDSV